MPDFLPIEAPAKTSPVTKRPANAQGARPRRVISTFNLTAQAIADRLMLPRIPKGARGVNFKMQSSVGLGAAATLAIGITGNTGKYRAAAIKNDTLEETVKTAVMSAAELTADEDPFVTIAAAALPGAGTLVIETHYNL